MPTKNKNRDDTNHQHREWNGGYSYRFCGHLRVGREQSGQLPAQILNNLEEMDQFLENHKLSKPKDNEIDNLNGPKP